MPKLSSIVYGDDREVIGYVFMCPGCKFAHVPYTKKHGDDTNPVWTYNGEDATCTFSPSLLVKYTWGPEKTPHVCHSFIRAGNIEFLNDCTHKLAGQTIPIPEWRGFDCDSYLELW